MRRIYHQIDRYLAYCRDIRHMADTTITTKRYINQMAELFRKYRS